MGSIMIRRVSPLLLLLTAVVGGCPATPEIEDVDGLGGGALTSPLTVPSLVATSISTTDVTAATVTSDTITGTAITTGTIAADEATLQSLVVQDQMATLDVVDLKADGLQVQGTASAATVRADRLIEPGSGYGFTSNPTSVGRVMIGTPVGVAGRNGGCPPDGHETSDCSCALTFDDPADPSKPEAHVCTAFEVQVAAGRGAPDIDATQLNGAAFNSFAVAQVGTLVSDGGATVQPIRTTDCASWTANGVNQVIPANAFGAMPDEYVAAKSTVVVTERAGQRPVLMAGFSTDCSTEKWLCCQ